MSFVRIDRLDHLVLTVRDVETTCRFYSTVLGMEVVTFGVGRRDRVERATVEWPSGRTEEFKDLSAGKAYVCTEGAGVKAEE